MILLADLGNTRLKLAWLHPNASLQVLPALAHAEDNSASRLAVLLQGERVDEIWLASSTVLPSATAIEQRLAQCAPLRCAGVVDGLGGLRLAYAQPQRLGIDRYLALLGALERGVEAGLIVLIGTAMTIDALLQGGRHLGGLILPSPTRMRAALLRDAPHLPAAAGRLVDFASASEDALESGCGLAAVALIERSLRALESAGAQAPRLLLGGGGAEALLPALPAASEHVPDLVLEGLARWGAATSKR